MAIRNRTLLLVGTVKTLLVALVPASVATGVFGRTLAVVVAYGSTAGLLLPVLDTLADRYT